jgi:hypothetical protein
MWYLLAEANGLSGNETLVAGRVLVVPNKVTNIHNNAQTFRPYSPGEAIGHLDPTLPAPPPPPRQDGGCGGIAQIVMIVVAVVVTIYTAGAAAGLMGTAGTIGGFGATMSAGVGVLTAGAAGTVTAGLAAGAALGAAAIGGAVGSIASQGAGMAMGAQDQFSWTQVGLSALGSAVTAGMGPAGAGAAGAAGSAAASSVVGQGIGVATGLQERLSWKAVAASAAGAGAGAAVGGAVNGTALGSALGGANGFGTQMVRGMAGTAVAQLVASGRVDATSAFASTLGNAMGESIVGEMSGTGTVDYDDDDVDVDPGQASEAGAAQNDAILARRASELVPHSVNPASPQTAPPALSDAVADSKAAAAAELVPKPTGDAGTTGRSSIIDPRRPGLYTLEFIRDRWTATEAVEAVTTDKAAINGMLNTPEGAVELMGLHMEAQFPGTTKFTLFYNPTEGPVADLAESFNDKMGMSTDIAKEFSGVLGDIQASGHRVDWVAHSQGGVIFSEAARINGGELSNNSVAFHGGANNELVTNAIMKDVGVAAPAYRSNPLDPVSSIAGFNTVNPARIVGSLLALPFVIWGDESTSPHTLPYVETPTPEVDR